MILLMMASGALVAGTRAGQVHNTWPKMGGSWAPEQLLAMQPWWRNLVENPIAIQFVHRWLAVMVVVIYVSGYAIRLIRATRRTAGNGRGNGQVNGGAWTGYALLAAVAAQFALGIATLILGVPVALGVAHQAGAMLLLTVAIIALTSRPRFFHARRR